MRGRAMTETITVEPRPAEPDATEEHAIRSCQIAVPEDELVDLRRRSEATRWPEKETVEDQSQGPRLATMQALARYWGAEYDWGKGEARGRDPARFVQQ